MLHEKSNKNKLFDPLGLSELSNAVNRLRSLRNELETDHGYSKRWTYCVDQLENAFAKVTLRYELLQDRYTFLKKSNAQLSDELIWLRDQIDDLSSIEINANNSTKNNANSNQKPDKESSK